MGKKPSFLTGLKIEKEENKNDKLDRSLVLNHYNLSEFQEIDLQTKEFLENKTFELHQVTSKAYTKLGNIFLEAQEKLSEHHGGTFERWVNLLGYKKTNVYRLISRSKLGRLYPEKMELIESLPISLSYEISSQNCNDELRESVLNGEIKTLKEFREFKTLMSEKETNIIRDITPVTYQNIKNKSQSLERILKKARQTIFDKELKEEKLEIVNKNLEKLEKDIENLFKALEE